MNRPRIQRVQLKTAVSLTKMKQFYHGVLGLAVLAETAEEVAFAAGQTALVFTPAQPAEGQPFYHFAFDIPENKMLAAYAWQRQKTPLLPLRPERFSTMHEAPFPDEVVHLPDWNAHAIYFLDPAGSLVEYCARHTAATVVTTTSAEPFTSQDLLYISEVGFVVDNIEGVAAGIVQATGLGHYRGAWTIGDEYGLILLLRLATPWGSVIGDRPKEVFPTAVFLHSNHQLHYKVPNLPYEIVMG